MGTYKLNIPSLYCSHQAGVSGLANWLRESLFYCPLKPVYARPERHNRDIQRPRPFGDSLPFPAILQEHVVFSIVGLGSWSSPTDIARFIITIVIDSVQRHTDRSRTHTGNKFFKRIKVRTNRNVPYDITMRISGFFVSASGPHIFPCNIFRGIVNAYRPFSHSIITSESLC